MTFVLGVLVGVYAGIMIGLVAGGVVYVTAFRHVKAMAVEDRRRAHARLDEIAEHSDRQFDATRRELGLPPRVRS